MNVGLDKLAMSIKNPIRHFRKILNFVLKYKFDKKRKFKNVSKWWDDTKIKLKGLISNKKNIRMLDKDVKNNAYRSSENFFNRKKRRMLKMHNWSTKNTICATKLFWKILLTNRFKDIEGNILGAPVIIQSLKKLSFFNKLKDKLLKNRASELKKECL